jgi:predicted nucleic acid-binding protein
MSAVFVDTSALYALFSSSDARYEDARSAVRELHGRRAPLVTTDLVLVESYILVHARGGLGALLAFRSALTKSTWLQTMSVSAEHQADAWRLLEQRTDKGYSFVDATSFVVMRALGVRQAFSFDAHFSQEGFERLGGRPGRA